MASMELKRKKAEPTSTVGRGKAITLKDLPINDRWSDEYLSLTFGNALNHYHEWETPTVIVSDGGYGVLGFEGDTSDHLGLPDWYEPHIAACGTDLPTEKEWADLRPKFRCPHGLTNVWRRNALRGNERVKTTAGKAIHLNQKPLDLMKVIIEATSDAGDVVWEPFGGLFTASLAARQLERKSFAAEIDPTYFQFGIQRFSQVTLPHSHLEFQDDAQVPF